MTPVWSITAMTANSSRSTRHPYTLLLFEPKKLSISSFLLSQEAAASLAAFTVHSLETPLRRRKKPFLLFQLKRMALRALPLRLLSKFSLLLPQQPLESHCYLSHRVFESHAGPKLHMTELCSWHACSTHPSLLLALSLLHTHSSSLSSRLLPFEARASASASSHRVTRNNTVSARPG